MLHGVLLVVSNVALFPIIYRMRRRGEVTSALIVTATFLASVAYHFCRAYGLCLYRYKMHVITDYFFVYTSFIWILTKLGLVDENNELDHEAHTFLFFIIAIPTYFVVFSEMRTMWLPIVGIGVPVFVTILNSYLTKRRLFYNKPWTVVTFILAILAGVFMFVAPDGWYAIAHTLWHLFFMAAAFTYDLAVEHNIATSNLNAKEEFGSTKAKRRKSSKRLAAASV